jgi:hypothetical protein
MTARPLLMDAATALVNEIIEGVPGRARRDRLVLLLQETVAEARRQGARGMAAISLTDDHQVCDEQKADAVNGEREASYYDGYRAAVYDYGGNVNVEDALSRDLAQGYARQKAAYPESAVDVEGTHCPMCGAMR